jgi:L-arabinose isomerase
MSGSAPMSDCEVWFIAGSQELYGPETLARVEAQAMEVAAGINVSEELSVRVVMQGVVTGAGMLHGLCLRANADERCVGVVVWMHTFSPAKMWISGLTALRKPLLHLHTQFNLTLPWSEIDMDFMNLNQSAHGDREFAYLATRMRLARKTVVGHWRDLRTLRRIGRWARAAYGWQELAHMSVARFGDNMRGVAVTEGDKVEAQLALGFSVDGFGVGDLTNTVAGVPAQDVQATVECYEQRYEIAPDLRRDGPRRSALVQAAAIETGLRSFLSDRGYAAFTDTFEDLHGLAQLPGIAAQQLMADGYGFAAEGDWKTAALVRLVKAMATGLPGGTSFMEDYTYDLTPGSEMVLGAHMLEICPSIAAQRPSCEIHPLAIGAREDPVRLVFDAAPGHGLLIALLDLGDRFRLLVNEIDVLSPEHELPHLPVARACWRPRPDFFTATEAWLRAGGPHHSVFTTALDVETIVDWATIAGLELVVIDGDTNLRAFANELRWNAGRYHPLPVP